MFKSALYLAGVFVVAGFLAPVLTARFLDGPKPASYAAPSVNSVKPTHPDNYGGHVRIPADRAGHYVTEVQINGRTFNVMVDTGASLVILRYEDARALGLVYGSDKPCRRRTAPPRLCGSSSIMCGSARFRSTTSRRW
jgi:predicted aspartyl protease